MTATPTAPPRAPAEPHRPAASRPQLPNPRIVRPRGLGRAARPGPVPTPEHHHLPGWVRRTHGQAQPILADQLGALEGERRAQLAQRVEELTRTISSGKFSQAWRYPQLIDEGQVLLEAQRRERAAASRQQHAVDTSRRRVGDQLREMTPRLPGDTATRLTRALRSANDQASIAAVSSEVERAVGTVRTAEERRRDREIDRTRARILRTLPRAAEAEPSGETWQDQLRRFAEQQAAEGS